MASVKVLLREEHIYIRVIENRKPKFKSLKIKIQKKFWNKSKQRVSPNYPDSEKINFIIEKKLKELEYLENNLNLVNENTKSILKYWDILIDNTTNRGSKEKHKNGKNTFFKYIQSIGKSDFLFMELQPHDVHAYFKYMRENGISNDTANYRIKAFKALINRAIEDKTIRYFDDPFATFKYKFNKKKNKALSNRYGVSSPPLAA